MLSLPQTRMFSALVLLLSLNLVAAVPWSMGSRSAIGSTTGGVISPLEAMGPHAWGESGGYVRHLTGPPEGHAGNLSVKVNVVGPGLFFVRKSQLYQYVNDTTIYPVSVHNVTIPRTPPLQLRTGRKLEGLRGGSWRFSGSMLYYDFPGRDDDLLFKENNQNYGEQYSRAQGLFYNCAFPDGGQGIFMFYYLQDAGVDCYPFTLHSWTHEKKVNPGSH